MQQLRLALFFGAGASVPYGKPTTQKLKGELFTKYRQLEAKRNQAEHYLYSILSFSQFEDIEHVLQCIKEIDDFFSRSHHGARYLLESDLHLEFRDPQRPWPLNTLTDVTADIRKLIEHEVFKKYAWDHSYDSVLVQILGSLFRLIKKYSEDIRVFTTNYDSAIEQYCSEPERNYLCIDGFRYNEYSHRRKWEENYDDPRQEGKTNVYLYKLHGSLNWKRHKTYGPEATSVERSVDDPNYLEDLLIYPTLSPKEGAEVEPYMTIRKQFEVLMDTMDACIVIGFSFRYEHINDIFSKFLTRGKSIIIVSPSADKTTFAHLLKKDASGTQYVMYHKTDRNIFSYFR
jgi:SIR2-like domain